MFTKDSKDKAEKKLVLLHLFAEIDYPLTNAEITDLAVSLDLMDYFTLQQYLGELVDGGMLEYSKSESDYYYLATAKGKDSLEYFKNRLPEGLLSLIEDKASDCRKKRSVNSKISCTHSKLGDSEYIVELKITENDLMLMNLELNVVSNKQAKVICSNWKNSSTEVYSAIIKMLTGEQ